MANTTNDDNFYVENFSISIALFVFLIILICLFRRITLIVVTCMLLLLFSFLTCFGNFHKDLKDLRNNAVLVISGLGILFFLSNITIDYLNNIYDTNSPFYFNLCLQILILLLGSFILYCNSDKTCDKSSKYLTTRLFQIIFVYSFIQLFFYMILSKEFKDYWFIALPTVITIVVSTVRSLKTRGKLNKTETNFTSNSPNNELKNVYKKTYLILTSSFILLLFESFLIRTNVVHLLTFAYCVGLVPIIYKNLLNFPG